MRAYTRLVTKNLLSHYRFNRINIKYYFCNFYQEAYWGILGFKKIMGTFFLVECIITTSYGKEQNSV